VERALWKDWHVTTALLETAGSVADAIADRLASPSTRHGVQVPNGWWPQSLAHGAAGVALLHIERARAGLGPWRRAHDWLAAAAGGEVLAGDDSHLHYGAPALAYALRAAADGQSRYARALNALDRRVATSTRRRLQHAHARLDRGQLPALAEFDAIRGLTGLGAYLLRRDPHGDLLRAVLNYLIRLIEPITDRGETVPGWWTEQAPSGRPSEEFPGGHGNNGMAHGVAGPLALLALAMVNGVKVAGQAEAIKRICAWLDRWRQGGKTRPWWPYWLTRMQLRTRTPSVPRPSRPSWCYGTAGLARAQQLAALATGDTGRQRMAEHALLSAMTDPRQLAATTDLSLCHGYAGLTHILRCAAADAITPQLAACVPWLLNSVLSGTAERLTALNGDIGLLEGATGIALALHSLRTDAPPASGWDAFLLIR
jgi:hypothetical protein